MLILKKNLFKCEDVIILKIDKIKILYYRITNKPEKIHQYKLDKYKKMGMKFGENFRCFSDIIGPEPYLIEIGNNVTISTNVSLITHDNSVIKVINGKTDTFGKIRIGDNCFIGSGTIILPGVNIANNIIVAAGSVITKSFNEPNIIIGGNPAKKISEIDIYKEKVKKYATCTTGMSHEEKKKHLLNDVRLLCK